MLESTGYSSRRAEIRKSDKTRVWQGAQEGRAHTSVTGYNSLNVLTYNFRHWASFAVAVLVNVNARCGVSSAGRAVMRSEKLEVRSEKCVTGAELL